MPRFDRNKRYVNRKGQRFGKGVWYDDNGKILQPGFGRFEDSSRIDRTVTQYNTDGTISTFSWEDWVRKNGTDHELRVLQNDRKYAIPFIPDKKVTISIDKNSPTRKNAGAVFSENLLDSIALNAKKAGLSFGDALGIVAQESTFGNGNHRGTGQTLLPWLPVLNQSSGEHKDKAEKMSYQGFQSPSLLISNWKQREENPYAEFFYDGKGNVLHTSKSKEYYDEYFRPHLVKGNRYHLQEESPLQHGFRNYKEHPKSWNYGDSDYQNKITVQKKELTQYSPEIREYMRKHGLRAYGGPLVQQANMFGDGGFSSELDWSPESWFGLRVPKPDGTLYGEEEAKILSSHVPEYLEIERAAKNNGSWLKMPDGSIYEGDPRGWVMMQSKAYNKNYSQQPWYTGQAEWPAQYDYGQGIIDTNKVTRAPYYDNQMWFSDSKDYGETFANYVGSDGTGWRFDRPGEEDIRGKNFIAAIPKAANYRILESSSNTPDYWRQMPFILENNTINRLPSSEIVERNRNGVITLNRADGQKILTDDVVNWSKDLGDDGVFMGNVEDGPVIKDGYIINKPINEFISQPGFTKKVKFIEGNTGDFNIDNPYKYALNNYQNDEFNYAAQGGSLNTYKQWQDLPIKERADIMKVAIRNGITNLADIKAKYNEFALGGQLEEPNLYGGGGTKNPLSSAYQKLNRINQLQAAGMTPQEAHAMQYYVDRGFAPHQAAGFVGGFVRESALDPTALNKDSGAYGIGQWLGPRKNALMKMYGNNPTFANELDYSMYELDNTTKEAKRRILSSSTPEEAATNAFNYYGAALDGNGVANMNRWGQDGQKSLQQGIDNAKRLYDLYSSVGFSDGGNMYSKGSWLRKKTQAISKATKIPATSKKSAPMSNSSAYAMQYFINKGLAPHQAAGLVGNLMRESGLNPLAINPGSKAYGLAQWLGARKKKLFSMYGNNPTLQNQLDFVWWELNNTHKNGLKHLMAARNAEEAARAGMNWFEFSNGDAISEMNKWGQDGRGSMRKGIMYATKLAGQPMPDLSYLDAPNPNMQQSQTYEQMPMGYGYSMQQPQNDNNTLLAFEPSNPQAFFAPLSSYETPVEQPVTQPLVDAAEQQYKAEMAERQRVMQQNNNMLALVSYLNNSGSQDSSPFGVFNLLSGSQIEV